MKMEQKSEEYILEIKDLSIYYELEEETVKALNGINLHLNTGETLGIVGETGAGKTTTALAMLNLIPDPPGIVKSGTINLCGYDVLSLSPTELEKIRGKDISMIFQDPMSSLNPVLTIGEQIAESILLHEGLNKSEAKKRAIDILEMVGISGDTYDDYPHQFSGGMRQRVVIAIALACSPKVLIADEPTTALDVTIQAQVLDLMNELKDKTGTSMIMITHDLGIVAEICDRVVVMYAGRIIEQGTLSDIFRNTLHPYTVGLFNSLPNLKDRTSKLIPIPGMMPDPTNLPVGCDFASRCEYVTEKCFKIKPNLNNITDSHAVACIGYESEDFFVRGR